MGQFHHGKLGTSWNELHGHLWCIHPSQHRLRHRLGWPFQILNRMFSVQKRLLLTSDRRKKSNIACPTYGLITLFYACLTNRFTSSSTLRPNPDVSFADWYFDKVF
jgi:hypothetical protein